MIKVLFDNQIYKTQNFGGISRYFSELMKGVNISKDFQSLPKKFYSSNEHLRLNGQTHYNWFEDTPRFRGKIRIKNYLIRKEEKRIIKLAEKGDYNVFHPTYYDSLFINYIPQSKPVVVTIYDMIHELYFKDLVIPAYKKSLISRSELIIAISQNTKQDILNLYPEIAESKIKVVYLGSSLTVSNIEPKKELPSAYILFVGNRWTYKNFIWFVNSVAPFLIKEKLNLLCAGAGIFNNMELALFAKLNLINQVHYFPINNDDDLVALYKNALCFVFPSLYEGFGIPILEAFSCRCPVILANASCFPEIAGDAALYFDTDNPESLVEQLGKIIYDKELADNIREAGFERNKLYSWDKMVQQHLEIYKSIKTN